MCYNFRFTLFQDKFEKISDLLSGNQVRSGDVAFTATEHPLGIKYCTLLLAKKFIVSATPIVYLWILAKVEFIFRVIQKFHYRIDSRNNCDEQSSSGGVPICSGHCSNLATVSGCWKTLFSPTLYGMPIFRSILCTTETWTKRSRIFQVSFSYCIAINSAELIKCDFGFSVYWATNLQMIKWKIKNHI